MLAGAAVLAATPAAAQELSRPVDADDAAREQALAPQPQGPEAPGEDRIAFAADRLDYDYDADVVTASGTVRMAREGYVVRADSVSWNRNSGEVVATGNVRTVDPDGNILYGDRVELTDTLKDGVIDNLLLVMDDGGRVAASRGERIDGIFVLENAAYTPCAVETAGGCPKEPTWKVTADRVTYDPETRRVRYRGARVTLFGIPIVPLPGLAHAAGGGSSSGLMVPEVGITGNNGLTVSQGYYWRLAPNRDASVRGYLFSQSAPMIEGRYRALTGNGAYQLGGYATYSGRDDGEDPAIEPRDRIRGSVEGNGRFQFADNWTARGVLRLASDRTFLRRYDISNDDRLRNMAQLERVGDASYFAVTGWAVQTMVIGEQQGAIPVALPVIDWRIRTGEPLLGGTVHFQANSLALTRTSGQDSQRLFASARWDLRRYTPLGQEVTFTLFGRGDLYHTSDTDSTDIAIYRGDEGVTARGIATAAVDVAWPFIGRAFGGTQVLTPRVQLVASPDIENLSVPNEDSRAIDLETSNLFALNRFPGYDRYEGNARVTYGLDWSLRRDDVAIDATIGQSYRLSNDATILPNGTGLSDRLSDVVGRVELRFRDLVRLTHRFRLDKDSGAIRRNEIDFTVGSRETYVTGSYLRLDRSIGPTVEDLRDREEAQLGGRVKFARFWSAFGSATVDLTSEREDPLSTLDGYSPVRHRLGLAYDDDCLSASITWKRDYINQGDAQQGDSVLFRLAFRNLGV